MTIQQVKDRVIRVIRTSTETEKPVTLETRLVTDLGLSSMEVLVLMGDLESAFRVVIPVSRVDHVETVEDLCQVIIDLLR
ncbi:MAG: acyl carrier protein [Clostridiales bacterium]|nr:acyl carrier protein [Clostridiales bacterium]